MRRIDFRYTAVRECSGDRSAWQVQLGFKTALAAALDVPLHLLRMAVSPTPAAATTRVPTGLPRLKVTVYVPLGTDERKKYELQQTIAVSE